MNLCTRDMNWALRNQLALARFCAIVQCLRKEEKDVSFYSLDTDRVKFRVEWASSEQVPNSKTESMPEVSGRRPI